MRKLLYGDNLDVIPRHVAAESVDLVYLDPPFKSDANYNILFRENGLDPDEAQWTAFKDTWLWDAASAQALAMIQDLDNFRLINLMNSLHTALGDTPMMAYLVNMAIRLHHIYGCMKNTGSLYLHCDPTASHYLKLILDSVFSPLQFRSEIIWRRTGSHNKMKRWAPVHDTIFFYTKTSNYVWNNPRRPYMNGHVEQYFVRDERGEYRTNYYGNVLTGSGTRKGESGQEWRGFDPTSKGRHWAIPSAIWEDSGIDPTGLSQHQKLEALFQAGLIKIEPGSAWPIYERGIKQGEGPAAPDIWAFQPYTSGTVFGSKDGIDEDVRWLSPQDQERLGYPTQKPLGLLRRIIEASSRPGDLVLDPFCGCGTTVEAAERLGRSWIGIDISPFAIQLVRRRRVEGAFPNLVAGVDFTVDGLPTSLAGADMLFKQDPKAFEIWAVSAVDGIPNPKKGPDKGVDGRLRFKPDGRKAKHAIVSVKGGKLSLEHVRSLIAVTAREESTTAGFGVLIARSEPTPASKAEAASAGTVEVAGRLFQKIQIITIEEILDGKRPRLPFLELAEIYRPADETSEGRQGRFEV